jgi:hypothetical protein
MLTPRRAAVWKMASEHALFAVVPVVFTVWMARYAAGHHSLAIDFHNAFWPAGWKVLHGIGPYVGPRSPAVAAGVAFVYPGPAALMFAPFALISRGAADVLFTVVCIAAVLGSLRLLGVRDWRLYGLAMLWPPVVSGWQTANVTLLIVLGLAVVWRVRDRPVALGVALVLIVSLKPFMWPIGIWLLASRRDRALGLAVGAALALNALAWGPLGIGSLHSYSALLGAVTRVEENGAYTPMALFTQLGAGHAAALALGVVIAVAAVLGCIAYARRGDDPRALLMAVATSLLASPLVWRHYFALLIVPIAIMTPRLSAAWLVPLLMYACPVTDPVLWQLSIALAAFALVLLLAVLMPPAGGERTGLMEAAGTAVRSLRRAVAIPVRSAHGA